MHYFGFIDESGVNHQDRFFGVGLLVIQDTGNLYQMVKRRYDQLRSITESNKRERIKYLLENNQIDELASMALKGKDFEMKFDRINSSNNHIYEALIKDYIRIDDVRFTALIIDKHNNSFNPTVTSPGTWEAYLTYSSIVISRELKNLKPDSLCTLIDYISKPSKITSSLEQEISFRSNQRLHKQGIKNVDLHCIQMESHANLLVQLVDVLLGYVVFDYKLSNNLISESLKLKRLNVVKTLIEKMKRNSLKGSFTCHNPSYFSVWEMDWTKKMRVMDKEPTPAF